MTATEYLGAQRRSVLLLLGFVLLIAVAATASARSILCHRDVL